MGNQKNVVIFLKDQFYIIIHSVHIEVITNMKSTNWAEKTECNMHD